MAGIASSTVAGGVVNILKKIRRSVNFAEEYSFVFVVDARTPVN